MSFDVKLNIYGLAPSQSLKLTTNSKLFEYLKENNFIRKVLKTLLCKQIKNKYIFSSKKKEKNTHTILKEKNSTMYSRISDD